MADKLTGAKNRLDKAKETSAELWRMLRWHNSNIERLKQERIDKKAERQSALAYGENVSKLTNVISRIDSKIEESEDAIVGLKQRMTEVETGINKLKQEVVWMELEADKVKLWKVARKYNEKAKELSLIVRDFWDLYDHVDNYRYDKDGYRWNFSSGICCDNFSNGALHRIPFFRIGNENPRRSSYCDEYLFELYYYRSSERRERKKQENVQLSEIAEKAKDSGKPENAENIKNEI